MGAMRHDWICTPHGCMTVVQILLYWGIQSSGSGLGGTCGGEKGGVYYITAMMYSGMLLKQHGNFVKPVKSISVCLQY